jgi:hypothetical protein
MAKAKTLIDRDALNSAPKRQVADLCVSIFDRIQQRRKEHQLLGLAAAFTLLCDACKVPAQDVFAAVKNLMADPMTSTGLAPQFQAMRFHLRTEVLDG